MKDIHPSIILAPLNCQHPARGIVVERSADHRLCILMVNDGKPATLDDWKDYTQTVLSNWPQGQPCLLLHDLHRSGFAAFNADMQRKFEELYHFRPGLERLVAVVLPTEWGVDRIAQLDIKMRELLAPYHYPVHWEVFTKRDAALRWLIQTYVKRSWTSR